MLFWYKGIVLGGLLVVFVWIILGLECFYVLFFWICGMWKRYVIGYGCIILEVGGFYKDSICSYVVILNSGLVVFL